MKKHNFELKKVLIMDGVTGETREQSYAATKLEFDLTDRQLEDIIESGRLVHFKEKSYYFDELLASEVRPNKPTSFLHNVAN